MTTTDFAKSLRVFLVAFLVFAALAPASPALAEGFFNMAHFVSNGEFAIGLEPEFTLTNGAGIGANLRYTQGLTDLNNLIIILGDSTGPLQFRAGGAFTFDIFPDVAGQPGIGIAAQGLYYRVQDPVSGTDGMAEIVGIPYIHKSFQTAAAEVDPFVAVPIGIALSSGGSYQWVSRLAVGSNFVHSEHFRSTLEFGIAINNSNSYVSGGITYYH